MCSAAVYEWPLEDTKQQSTILNMTPTSLIYALIVLPSAIAHMQMLIPSPLRSPHSDRVNEIKDYNILTPLRADGSDFACKGYQYNTPWTTVATYEAGETYNMTLLGEATHGGGSCQLSISCDGGQEFKVIRSVIGGCPLQKQYDFTIPPELGKLHGTNPQCLFAWTWFNRIGNREMYMNCAVVEITSPALRKKVPQNRLSYGITKCDTAIINTAAQKALDNYPDLFVANLEGINSCVVPETVDVVFDDPGKATSYGGGNSASTKPSFRGGACTGVGKRRAEGSSTSSSESSASALEYLVPDASALPQVHGAGSHQGMPEKGSTSSETSDGMWHPDTWGSDSMNAHANQQQGEAIPVPLPQEQPTSPSLPQLQQHQHQQSSNLQPIDVDNEGKPLSSTVQKDLDAYLAILYGKTPGHMLIRRDASYANSEIEPTPFQTLSLDRSNAERLTDSSHYDAARRNDHDQDVQEDIHEKHSKQLQYHDHKLYNGKKQDEILSEMTKSFMGITYNAKEYSHPRLSRGQRWAKYALPRELDQRADSNSTNLPEKALVHSYGTFSAFLRRLGDIKGVVFILTKNVLHHLDLPPPPNTTMSMIGNANTSAISRVLTQGTRPVVKHTGNKYPMKVYLNHGAGIVRPTGSQITRWARHITNSTEVRTLKKIHVLEALKGEQKASNTVHPIGRRQSIITGIFPVSVQNATQWYISTFAPWLPKAMLDKYGIHIGTASKNSSSFFGLSAYNTTQEPQNAASIDKPLAERNDNALDHKVDTRINDIAVNSLSDDLSRSQSKVQPKKDDSVFLPFFTNPGPVLPENIDLSWSSPIVDNSGRLVTAVNGLENGLYPVDHP